MAGDLTRLWLFGAFVALCAALAGAFVVGFGLTVLFDQFLDTDVPVLETQLGTAAGAVTAAGLVLWRTRRKAQRLARLAPLNIAVTPEAEAVQVSVSSVARRPVRVESAVVALHLALIAEEANDPMERTEEERRESVQGSWTGLEGAAFAKGAPVAFACTLSSPSRPVFDDAVAQFRDRYESYNKIWVRAVAQIEVTVHLDDGIVVANSAPIDARHFGFFTYRTRR